MKVLFNYHNREHMSLKDSIEKTTSLLMPIWEMARIPTKAAYHVVEHIRKLHTEWQLLKKCINRQSATNLTNQQTFQDSLDDLFDIAHRDALSLIKIEEDRLFLKAQREKGRRGTMSGIDRSLTLKEERAMKRKSAAANYELKVRAAAGATPTDVFDGNDSGESDSSSSSGIQSDSEAGPSTAKIQKLTSRGTVNVVTPEVAAALDRTNTSDRKAAHILSAMTSSGLLQHEVEDLIISPSAIRRARIKHRELLASEIQASFDPQVPLVLHWDGKIVEDFTGPGREHVDRLPVLVSGENVVKLLSIPKLHDGTATTITKAVTETIEEWGLRDRIKGLCFDTTASNTGIKGGVCLQLETHIGHELLNLACRHHISEVMLENVFRIYDVSKSPNIELFQHFKEFWPQINQKSFSTAADDESMANMIAPWKDDVIQFAEKQLEQHQPRDDYRELLELSIVFLGGTPPRGIRFQYPGAVHRARWMARAIYAIKMWLFHNQYEPLQPSKTTRTTRGPSFSDKIWNHLKNICLFVTSVYIRYWFQCPSSTAAPRNDLEMLCSLYAYPQKEVAKVATAALGRHLWYLSELLVGFAFFDDEVPVEEKRLMVLALKENEGSEEPLKRIPLFAEPAAKGIHDFVTTSTKRFFQILDLSEEFLQYDPDEWGFQETYKLSQRIAQNVKVVNDLAERGVALMQTFNSSLTRSEEQKQFLLQVVEDHRKKFKTPTKSVAVAAFSKQK